MNSLSTVRWSLSVILLVSFPWIAAAQGFAPPQRSGSDPAAGLAPQESSGVDTAPANTAEDEPAKPKKELTEEEESCRS